MKKIKLKQLILKVIMILYIFIDIFFIILSGFVLYINAGYGAFQNIDYVGRIILELLFYMCIFIVIYSIISFIINKNNRYFYLLILYIIYTSIYMISINSSEISDAILFVLIPKVILAIAYITYIIEKEKSREID